MSESQPTEERCLLCGDPQSRALFRRNDCEVPVLLITRDEEGDFIARDLARDGCVCHADSEAGAYAHLQEARQQYDEALSPSVGEATSEGSVSGNPERKDAMSQEPKRRFRTEEQLRNTVAMLAHFIWFRQTRPGDHMWSIPVDHERDFDCILSDAIDELVEWRAVAKAREAGCATEDTTHPDGENKELNSLGDPLGGTPER